MRQEDLILSALFCNESYVRAVLPHLSDEYFEKTDAVIYNTYSKYFQKYNTIPTKEAIWIEASKEKLSEDNLKKINNFLGGLKEVSENTKYLVELTEQFCKDRAVYNALMQSVQIVDGRDPNYTPEAIPSILQKALSICFDKSVGHDFEDNAEDRYEYYHRKENKISTGISIFDDITDGGVSRKTFNVILAPPHGGKSLMMVNFAIGAMKAGYNVLYITMEMAEEEIAKRFDVNLMNTNFDTLKTMTKPIFMNKLSKIKEKALGKLKIKQYPTAGAHVGHFKTLIEDLKTKQEFVPDLVVVDYMNICLSQRYKAGSSANSYTIVKSIGEELRALAIETDTAVWSATQTTRAGIGNSDVDMTNTSESIGIPAIADFFVAIIDSEELRKMNQILIKQLKNRYRDKNDKERFLVGIERAKMKLFDLEASAQSGITDFKAVDVPLNTVGNNESTSPPWDVAKPKDGFQVDGWSFD